MVSEQATQIGQPNVLCLASPWMASRAPSTAAKDATLSIGATAAYAGIANCQGPSVAPPVEAQPVEPVLALDPELHLWQSALANKPRS